MKRLLDWLRQIFNPPRPQEDNRAYWYNFDTKHFDFITPTDFAPYLPVGSAQSLYHLYVDHKDLSPLDAATKVLEACVTKKDKDQVNHEN